MSVCLISNQPNNCNQLSYAQFTSNDAVVEGRDFVVSYQIVNTGNAAATKIEVSDRYDPARCEN